MQGEEVFVREANTNHIPKQTVTGDRRDTTQPRTAVAFVRIRVQPYDASAIRQGLHAQQESVQQIADRLGARVIRTFVAIGGTAEPTTRQVVATTFRFLASCPTNYLIVERI